jgi:hypothetical protein
MGCWEGVEGEQSIAVFGHAFDLSLLENLCGLGIDLPMKIATDDF